MIVFVVCRNWLEKCLNVICPPPSSFNLRPEHLSRIMRCIAMFFMFLCCVYILRHHGLVPFEILARIVNKNIVISLPRRECHVPSNTTMFQLLAPVWFFPTKYQQANWCAFIFPFGRNTWTHAFLRDPNNNMSHPGVSSQPERAIWTGHLYLEKGWGYQKSWLINECFFAAEKSENKRKAGGS